MVEINGQAVQEAAQAGSVQQKRKREKGFTLIEMMAVVIILAIVGGVGFVAVNNQVEKSRKSSDAANIKVIVDAAQQYYLDTPNMTSTTGASADWVKTNLVPGYLSKEPMDPWEKAAYKVTIAARTAGTSDGTITVESPHTGGADTVTVTLSK
jgi:prepilin-type N-terminal cleavage/methylation domain-containing protein